MASVTPSVQNTCVLGAEASQGLCGHPAMAADGAGQSGALYVCVCSGHTLGATSIMGIVQMSLHPEYLNQDLCVSEFRDNHRY